MNGAAITWSTWKGDIIVHVIMGIILPPNLLSRSHEIGCYNDHIVVKFDRHLDSAADEVKFLCDSKGLNLNLAASRLPEILR